MKYRETDLGTIGHEVADLQEQFRTEVKEDGEVSSDTLGALMRMERIQTIVRNGRVAEELSDVSGDVYLSDLDPGFTVFNGAVVAGDMHTDIPAAERYALEVLAEVTSGLTAIESFADQDGDFALRVEVQPETDGEVWCSTAGTELQEVCFTLEYLAVRYPSAHLALAPYVADYLSSQLRI